MNVDVFFVFSWFDLQISIEVLCNFLGIQEVVYFEFVMFGEILVFDIDVDQAFSFVWQNCSELVGFEW